METYQIDVKQLLHRDTFLIGETDTISCLEYVQSSFFQ